MGNRAVITFDETPNAHSMGIYLHWNGGPESVLAFLEAANHFKVRDDNDSTYQLSRVVQIIANFFGGTNSIGVGPLSKLDCDNCDNGLFSVSRKNGLIRIRQRKHDKAPWVELDLGQLRNHQYFKASPSLLEEVIKANAEPFKDQDA